MTVQLDGFHGISTAYACIETITNDCIGLHLSLPWDLFEARNDLPSIELIVRNKLVDIAKIGFRYAYCDHEAYIDHPIKEVIKKKNLYSILVTNKNGDICCYYAPWMIDGLTQRDSR